MPRCINFDSMEWSVTRYGRNELGVGGIEIVGADEYSLRFLNNDEFQNAKKHCGLFLAKIQDKNSPRENPDALADEIFRWVEDNLRGKWFVFEGLVCHSSVGYQHYVIEDETDRQKFQAQWGHVFEYTKPSAKTPEPALTQYELTEQEQVRTKLRAGWDQTRQILPLYGYSAQSWLFVAARINGKDRLFIVPENQRTAIESQYSITFERNKVKHMGDILNGQNDLEAGNEFTEMVYEMRQGYGRDMISAREVCVSEFGCFINESEDSAEFRGMEETGRIFSLAGDRCYDGKKTTLQDVRDAYQKGKTVSFFMQDISFTYGVDDPLVSYREKILHGITMISQGGGVYSGRHVAGVFGSYRKDTGVAHGQWRRNYGTTGNSGDGHRSPNYEALYNDGLLINGSLGSDGRRFQPAALDTRIIGYDMR